MILHHFIFIFTLKKKKHIGRFTFYGNFFFIILKFRPVFGNGKCRFGVVLIVLMCVSAKGELSVGQSWSEVIIVISFFCLLLLFWVVP